MIPFTKPSLSMLEYEYVQKAIESNHLSGDGLYSDKSTKQINQILHTDYSLLTVSGTAALELAALLLSLQIGDEVILPSYTFSSTANAFMLRGAVPIFCEIRSDTMNINEKKIEELITPKTKAICVVDYAGVPCEMNEIRKIAHKHHLMIVEDAAQAVGSTYQEEFAGTLGDIGCFSFHNTKNYTMGEGGALICTNREDFERAEIIREKGTNRKQLLKGAVDKYTWHEVGSSYLPSDVLAAILTGQLERFDEIMNKRLTVWNFYHEQFASLEKKGTISRPLIPKEIRHNAHMYYLILSDKKTRDESISLLKDKGIQACFHYMPLHSAPVGLNMGYQPEDLPITEEYAGRLLRIPLFTDMTLEDADAVVKEILTLF